MTADPFKVILPSGEPVPILLSVPHCGTAFPDDLRQDYSPDALHNPDDTDWFVDRLYDFAPAQGITMITAVYHRWVIDLNRDPQGKPLYNDGRLITGLCPTTTFLGQPLYRDNRQEVSKPEVQRRLRLYFNPYHETIRSLLSGLVKKFGTVLLWDCHSIRQYVPSIHPDKFPDLILGDSDGLSCSPALSKKARESLHRPGLDLRYNYKFKGGFITRHFGDPDLKIHALQLEMSKINYMDDTETAYDAARAEKIRELLIRTLAELAAELKNGR